MAARHSKCAHRAVLPYSARRRRPLENRDQCLAGHRRSDPEFGQALRAAGMMVLKGTL